MLSYWFWKTCMFMIYISNDTSVSIYADKLINQLWISYKNGRKQFRGWQLCQIMLNRGIFEYNITNVIYISFWYFRLEQDLVLNSKLVCEYLYWIMIRKIHNSSSALILYFGYNITIHALCIFQIKTCIYYTYANVWEHTNYV